MASRAPRAPPAVPQRSSSRPATATVAHDTVSEGHDGSPARGASGAGATTGVAARTARHAGQAAGESIRRNMRSIPNKQTMQAKQAEMRGAAKAAMKSVKGFAAKTVADGSDAALRMRGRIATGVVGGGSGGGALSPPEVLAGMDLSDADADSHGDDDTGPVVMGLPSAGFVGGMAHSNVFDRDSSMVATFADDRSPVSVVGLGAPAPPPNGMAADATSISGISVPLPGAFDKSADTNGGAATDGGGITSVISGTIAGARSYVNRALGRVAPGDVDPEEENLIGFLTLIREGAAKNMDTAVRKVYKRNRELEERHRKDVAEVERLQEAVTRMTTSVLKAEDRNAMQAKEIGRMTVMLRLMHDHATAPKAVLSDLEDTVRALRFVQQAAGKGRVASRVEPGDLSSARSARSQRAPESTAAVTGAGDTRAPAVLESRALPDTVAEGDTGASDAEDCSGAAGAAAASKPAASRVTFAATDTVMEDDGDYSAGTIMGDGALASASTKMGEGGIREAYALKGLWADDAAADPVLEMARNEVDACEEQLPTRSDFKRIRRKLVELLARLDELRDDAEIRMAARTVTAGKARPSYTHVGDDEDNDDHPYYYGQWAAPTRIGTGAGRRGVGILRRRDRAWSSDSESLVGSVERDGGSVSDGGSVDGEDRAFGPSRGATRRGRSRLGRAGRRRRTETQRGVDAITGATAPLSTLMGSSRLGAGGHSNNYARHKHAGASGAAGGGDDNADDEDGVARPTSLPHPEPAFAVGSGRSGRLEGGQLFMPHAGQRHAARGQFSVYDSADGWHLRSRNDSARDAEHGGGGAQHDLIDADHPRAVRMAALALANTRARLADRARIRFAQLPPDRRIAARVAASAVVAYAFEATAVDVSAAARAFGTDIAVNVGAEGRETETFVDIDAAGDRDSIVSAYTPVEGSGDDGGAVALNGAGGAVGAARSGSGGGDSEGKGTDGTPAADASVGDARTDSALTAGTDEGKSADDSAGGGGATAEPAPLTGYQYWTSFAWITSSSSSSAASASAARAAGKAGDATKGHSKSKGKDNDKGKKGKKDKGNGASGAAGGADSDAGAASEAGSGTPPASVLGATTSGVSAAASAVAGAAAPSASVLHSFLASWFTSAEPSTPDKGPGADVDDDNEGGGGGGGGGGGDAGKKGSASDSSGDNTPEATTKIDPLLGLKRIERKLLEETGESHTNIGAASSARMASTRIKRANTAPASALMTHHKSLVAGRLAGGAVDDTGDDTDGASASGSDGAHGASGSRAKRRSGARKHGRGMSVMVSMTTRMPPAGGVALPHRRPTRGLRVLCMDGGGIRGLLMVDMLRRIEQLTGRRIHEMFDLICGTSTGGFLSIMVGLKKWPLAMAAQAFEHVRKLGGQGAIMSEVKRLAMGASHDAASAEQLFDGLFGVDTMAEMGASPLCFVVAASVNAVPPQPYLFRNYELREDAFRHSEFLGTSKCTVAEAARATTAAPTYYAPAVIHGQKFVDGAIVANNPVLVALSEAAAVWPDREIECVVSLGTGDERQKTMRVDSVMAWVKNLLDLSMNPDMNHRVVSALLGRKYFRFQPDSGEGDVDLIEVRTEVIQGMLESGRKYIARNDARFRRLADLLTRRSGVAGERIASKQRAAASGAGASASATAASVSGGGARAGT